MLTRVKSRGKSQTKLFEKPVSTMAGQAASRTAIDTQLGFRQRSPRKPKQGWAVIFYYSLRNSQLFYKISKR